MQGMIFTTSGRIARLPYLGWSFLTYAGAVATIALAMRSGDTFTLVFVGAVSFFVAIWIQVALQGKRLHDMGFSAMHLVWIWTLSVLGAGFEARSDIGYILTIVSMVIQLCLLFTPGTKGSNAYGPQPGAPVTPAVTA